MKNQQLHSEQNSYFVIKDYEKRAMSFRNIWMLLEIICLLQYLQVIQTVVHLIQNDTAILVHYFLFYISRPIILMYSNFIIDLVCEL